MTTGKLSLKTNLNSNPSFTEEDISYSQFSPDNSPTLKASFSPSEVLLFKGVPNDLLEIEIMQLFQPFGLVKDILIAHHKRYLFVQFENVDEAISCYQSLTANIPHIRGHDMYACYTGKSEISKPKALLNPTSRFLHLKFDPSITNLTTQLVVQLLPSYSAYQRISLKKRTKTWEAFIEMDDVFKAIYAKEYINQSQYFLDNQVTITFSSEKDFPDQNPAYSEEFKEENYDDFALPPAQMEIANIPEEATTFSMTAFPCFSDPYLNSSPVLSPMRSPINKSMSPQRQRNHGSPLISPKKALFNQYAFTYDPTGSPILGSVSPMNGSPQFVPLNVNHYNVNSVIYVKELPENITPLMLFRLFGMYGNVLKVKILFNHPDKAFIEFQSPLQAELARRSLNNCSIMGRVLSVDFAAKGTIVDVTLLRKEPDNKYLGDFSESSEHRYKYVGSKNHANISPPSKVLHLSNLHPERDEDFYHSLFEDYGKIKKFMFMKNTERMALVEMNSVEDALNILMHFHNYDINGKYLKVTFSKYKKVK